MVRLRVLHIDDDPFQTANMEEMLKVVANVDSSLELTVIQAVDCKSALAETRADSAFDLVLCDYMLPGGDGPSILSMLRASIGRQATIAILSSLSMESELQRKWLHLGADCCQIKPLSLRVVNDLVTYALRKRGSMQTRGCSSRSRCSLCLCAL